jgi:excisionase family DNA binding protein
MKGSGTSAASPYVELLTVADLAAVLRLKPATVWRMAARGEIGYHRLNGKDLRFSWSDVDRLLARTRIEPAVGGVKG